MNSGFSFDEKALKRLASDALRDASREANRELARVHRNHAGQSASSIEPTVRRALKGSPVEGDRRTISQFAKAISEGRTVEIRA